MDLDGDSCHSTGNNGWTVGFGWITFIPTNNTKMVSNCAEILLVFILMRNISII